MLSRLGLVIASAGLLLAACSSGSEEPQPSSAQVAAESATAYAAGQSESAKAESKVEAGQSGEALQKEGERVPEQVGDGDRETEQVVAQDEAGQGEQERVPEQVGDRDDVAAEGEGGEEEEAMVGMIIESGHRAGLIAHRNVVGDPDAPIVITEYSDFL